MMPGRLRCLAANAICQPHSAKQLHGCPHRMRIRRHSAIFCLWRSPRLINTALYRGCPMGRTRNATRTAPPHMVASSSWPVALNRPLPLRLDMTGALGPQGNSASGQADCRTRRYRALLSGFLCPLFTEAQVLACSDAPHTIEPHHRDIKSSVVTCAGDVQGAATLDAMSWACWRRSGRHQAATRWWAEGSGAYCGFVVIYKLSKCIFTTAALPRLRLCRAKGQLPSSLHLLPFRPHVFLISTRFPKSVRVAMASGGDAPKPSAGFSLSLGGAAAKKPPAPRSKALGGREETARGGPVREEVLGFGADGGLQTAAAPAAQRGPLVIAKQENSYR